MLTLLAGVRVPSTSKRQIVFFTGRSLSAGTTLAATAVVAAIVSAVFLILSMCRYPSCVFSVYHTRFVASSRDSGVPMA